MIKNINHICFDLDGTLVDSHKTIFNSTIKSLNDLNIQNDLDETIFKDKIGMHFVDIFEDMNIRVTDFEEFIQVYKKNYFSFINDSQLYPNTEKTLEYLSKKGFIISLLTTKAQDQAEKILAHFNISKYFNVIMGRRNGIAHKPSPEPLLMICDEVNVSPEYSLIVGDTELDIICGKNAKVRSCAVTFGYRSEDVIRSYEPDYIVRNLSELCELFPTK
ncbi:MAG: HAD-IA family hydrolase [Ignavibacteriaceae bacterium]|nr:HAD-IA family hydrolase [Ignavibacteriaceae bacterium]